MLKRAILISITAHSALDNISIAAPQHQITVLIGPSGCGKSTLLRAMNRMHDRTPSARRSTTPTGPTSYWMITRFGPSRRAWCRASFCTRILRRPGAVVFGAAQGVLLDEWRGFHPHTTWSTTTLANADRLLGEAGYNGALTRVGITRLHDAPRCWPAAHRRSCARHGTARRAQ